MKKYKQRQLNSLFRTIWVGPSVRPVKCKVYDSLSGHGYLVGARTCKVVRMAVLCKKCSICGAHNRTQNVEDILRICTINHDGSSGSMESKVRCHMLEEICDVSNGAVYVDAIVSNDDSKFHSKLCHVNNDEVLKPSIPEPHFL